MPEVILFSAFVLAVGVYEVPRLARKRFRREAVIVSFLLLAGLVLGIAALKLVKIPSPLGILQFIYQPISSWFFQK
ncbi:hypothetical protein [Paenibacillus spongiae]|uniref:Uncharacterized protein n=1 Tax=Paenibacillus spongiae TaxID=2909671 RepID=A0ABY5S5D3_9BACL|nr:hypothetical protein [Paenibacillus spongiae]UVI28874.1 hypothetical protein L1F29_26050 [Paenibacillus spongiae]